MTPINKKSRARSEEKKADQFERNFETSKKLFLRKIMYDFRTGNLAKMFDMIKNDFDYDLGMIYYE